MKKDLDYFGKSKFQNPKPKTNPKSQIQKVNVLATILWTPLGWLGYQNRMVT
jgi:hypothetical protein